MELFIFRRGLSPDGVVFRGQCGASGVRDIDSVTSPGLTHHSDIIVGFEFLHAFERSHEGGTLGRCWVVYNGDGNISTAGGHTQFFPVASTFKSACSLRCYAVQQFSAMFILDTLEVEAGDVVGYGIDHSTMSLFFTLNGTAHGYYPLLQGDSRHTC